MKALASLAMRGYTQAAMLTVVLGVLSLLMPPASMFSSAIIALVTLRKGAVPGAIVMAQATLATAVLTWLLLGGVVPALGFLLLLWLPLWGLALLLRWSRDLSWSLQGGVVVALLVLLGQYWKSDDPVAEWQQLLEPFVQALVDAQLLAQAQLPVLVEQMAQWMPGVVAAGFFLQSAVALFLARWWQAMLYNPGGFRTEFHQLRVPKLLVLLLGALLLMQLLLGQRAVGWLDYGLLLLVMLWALHGLALAHGLIAKFKANRGWLIGIYLLLLFALPQMLVFLALAGMTDAWFDFRARPSSRDDSGEAG